MERNERRKGQCTYYEFPESGFISKPSKNKLDGLYVWNGVEIFESSKGKGLRATQMLPSGLMIPYGGVFLTNINNIKQKCENNKNSDWSDYLIMSKSDNDNNSIAHLDAHQRHYPQNGELKNAWIGSLVNEPSVGEIPNSEFVWCDKTIKFPKYPLMDKNMNVFIQLKQTVYTWEEILVDYGYCQQTREDLHYETYNFPKNKRNNIS